MNTACVQLSPATPAAPRCPAAQPARGAHPAAAPCRRPAGAAGPAVGAHLPATAANVSNMRLSDKTFTYSITKGAILDVSLTGAWGGWCGALWGSAGPPRGC